MKNILLSILLLFLCSCGILPLPFSPPKTDTTGTDVIVFQDLLKAGWDIQVYDNKVVLTKDFNKTIVIYDVFNALEH